MFWWMRKQMRSSDPRIRARAAEKLAQEKAESAYQTLLATFNDSNEEVRRAAVLALSSRGDVRTVSSIA